MVERMKQKNEEIIRLQIESEAIKNERLENSLRLKDVLFNYEILKTLQNEEKSKIVKKKVKILEQDLKKLPEIIPGKLMDQEKAMKLGYFRILNCQNAINHLKQKVELGNFIYSNLKKKDSIYSLTSARLSSVASRLRIILYQIMIVSLARLPFLVCFLIMSLEVIFLFFYILEGFRHRHPREWLTYFSKLNTSFLNLIILINIMFCIVMGRPTPLPVQSLLIMIILLIIVFEFFILILRILSKIFGFIFLVYNRFGGSRNKIKDSSSSTKMFTQKWVKGSRLTGFLNQI